MNGKEKFLEGRIDADWVQSNQITNRSSNDGQIISHLAEMKRQLNFGGEPHQCEAAGPKRRKLNIQ